MQEILHSPVFTGTVTGAPKSRNLYTIGEDLTALEELLLEEGGDITDEAAEKAIDEWLRETSEALEVKLARYTALIREAQSREVMRALERQRIAKLEKADSNMIERLKRRLHVFMLSIGKKKLETGTASLTVCGVGGKATLTLNQVWKDNPELAPERYRTVTVKTIYELDTDLIRAELEAGGIVEGCKINERGTYLKIK